MMKEKVTTEIKPINLLLELLPFGISFDRFFRIEQIGRSLSKLFPNLSTQQSFFDYFHINMPNQVETFEDLKASMDKPFIVHSNNGDIELKGTMKWIDPVELVFFACSPSINGITKLAKMDLSITDFVHHDQTPDFLFILQAQNNYINEIDQLAKMLNIQKKELQRSNEELQSFAYVASHDLKSPLRNITSFAQLIKKRYEGAIPAEGQEMIDHLIQSAKRMNELVSDLLNFSKLNTEKKVFYEVVLDDLVEMVKQDLEFSLAKEEAVLQVYPLHNVIGDEKRLYQVFSNLINNALKFRKPDLRPVIEIGSKEKQECFLFYVKDNGIGIDMECGDRIFDLFQRLHGDNDYEGTGIGLSICKKIIQGHRGEIWYESKLDKGTVFYFTIAKETIKVCF